MEQRKINILDFEEMLKGIDPSYYLDVKTRPQESFNSNMKYYVCFNGSNIKEPGAYTGASGDGNSPDDAIENYCPQISGQVLVFGFGEDAFRIKVPELFYLIKE